MTLQASGAISIGDINVELGRARSAVSSLGESALRTLAGVPSGAISMSNFYGKSNFSAVWSGTSHYGSNTKFEVSGTAMRSAWYDGGSVGAWQYAYTDGTFSSGVSHAVNTTYGTHGFQTSGNALRALYLAYNGVYSYGAWMYFSIGDKWGNQHSTMTGTNAFTFHAYQSSSGLFRVQWEYGPLYGNWISLN